MENIGSDLGFVDQYEAEVGTQLIDVCILAVVRPCSDDAVLKAGSRCGAQAVGGCTASSVLRILTAINLSLIHI